MALTLFLSTILILLIASHVLEPNLFPQIGLVWGADAYGSDIQFIEVYQWNGTAYNLVENFTSSGGSCRVVENNTIKFIVGIKFNKTLASDNAEAISFTRVYSNITDGGSIWNNEELNHTSIDSDANFYYLKENGVWNETGKPSSGVTYNCSFLYQGYY